MVWYVIMAQGLVNLEKGRGKAAAVQAKLARITAVWGLRLRVEVGKLPIRVFEKSCTSPQHPFRSIGTVR